MISIQNPVENHCLCVRCYAGQMRNVASVLREHCPLTGDVLLEMEMVDAPSGAALSVRHR